MLIGIIPEHLTAYRIHQHLVGQENLLLGKPKQNLKRVATFEAEANLLIVLICSPIWGFIFGVRDLR